MMMRGSTFAEQSSMSRYRWTWKWMAVAIIAMAPALAGGQAGGQDIPSTQALKSADAIAAVAKYEKAIAAAKAVLCRRLTAVMEQATRSGDLDEAIVLHDAIGDFSRQPADQSMPSAPPAAPGAGATPSIPPHPGVLTAAQVLGAWQVTNSSNGNWQAQLQINADNTYQQLAGVRQVHGTWGIEGQSLVLTSSTRRPTVYTMHEGTLTAALDTGSTLQAVRATPSPQP
jgi:hypothetical protein